MRTLILALLIVSGIAAPLRADEASEILKRAVTANAGSEESLAKRKFCLLKQSGVIYLPTGAAVAARTGTLALPDRSRWVVDMKAQTGAVSITVVLNGLRGWQKLPTGVADLPPSQYDSVQNEAYTYWLANLLPFQSKSIKWEVLKDATVDGKTARVLKATQTNRPIVTLFFDRDTFLVVKAAYAGTENFQPKAKEYVFSGHREIEGQRLPGKVQVFENGKKIEEWNNESFRFPASLDDKEFGKPQ